MMMNKLFEAAFRPPSRASAATDQNGSFVVLPHQSEDELVLSEVHSKLDRVLSFLQRDIGYSLLDDARPRAGGGLKIERRPANGPGDAVPRGSLSTKMPTEVPAATPGDDEETKEEMRFNSAEPAATASEVIRYSPEMAKYAHCPDDLVLVWRFAMILGEAFPTAVPTVNSVQIYKTVLQGVRFMHLCQYNYSDVVLTLAYASVYFKQVFKAVGHNMNGHEAAHVCVLLIYLAHSYVLDETCPLKQWHRLIFRKYSTLKVLDAALFRLFRMREYKLRISKREEKRALRALLSSSSDLSVHLSLVDSSSATSKGRGEIGSPSGESSTTCSTACSTACSSSCSDTDGHKTADDPAATEASNNREEAKARYRQECKRRVFNELEAARIGSAAA